MLHLPLPGIDAACDPQPLRPRWRVTRSARRVVSQGCLPAAAALIMLGSGCALSPPPPGSDDTPNPNALIAREIEEADIVKLQDGFFYLANSFTGLRIIDARDIDQPTMLGGVRLGGRSVELFVRDDRAFVFTAADFLRCAGEPVGFADGSFDELIRPDYQGSRLWIIDISDKSAPLVVTRLEVDGFVTATRRVGDVIYVAGNLASSLLVGPGVFVTSINIAEPEAASVVATETFPGASLDIHVSADAMYVVGNDPQLTQTTLVTYVDISDPAGEILVRDQFRVPGIIQNRFFVDDFGGTFRIITEEFIRDVFTRVVALYIYDVTDPNDVTRLARLPIVIDESLRAVRFDGVRGYAVTFRLVDPLFVFDLSDPADPSISGELEVPGFSTHLVPLGDRLVGVGFDDTAGVRPAVALYDVADPSNPRLLSRIIVGDRFSSDTSSEATVDEKALRVVEDAGLILLPFSTFDRDTASFVDSLQLIGLEPGRLRERGRIDHRGLVRRADVLDQRVWILSDVTFQSIDVDDLDAPVSLTNVEIISDQELLDAGLRSCADSARFRGTRFFGGFGGCGGLGFLLLFASATALVALRLARCGSPRHLREHG